VRTARLLSSPASWLPGLALVSLACGPMTGPVSVEALVADVDDPKRFTLDTVVLESVDDLSTGHGSLFDVRGGISLKGQSILDDFAEQQFDYDELLERSRRDIGVDMAPRMTWDGERWLADDFDTLHYFSMFHNLERAWSFARDEVGDTSPATREESLLGFYSSLASYDALPIPLRSSDNAAYVAFADAWLTFRVVFVQSGVPFAMNPGVVAHEFHHRVFFQNVFRGPAYENWRAWLTTSGSTRAGNLIMSLDEGLADIFAVGLTRDASFMSPTLTGAFAGEAAFRDLEAEFAEEVTYDALSAATLPTEQQNHCGFTFDASDQIATARFNFYCAGTAVARALWEGADFDFEVLRAEVLPAVNRALPEVGRRIALASGTQEIEFDLDMFLDAFAAELPPSVRADTCDAFARRFSSLVEEGRVPACP